MEQSPFLLACFIDGLTISQMILQFLVSGAATESQIGVPVIVGSAVGGAVPFILVLLILVMVMAAVIIRRRSQSRPGKVPGKCMRLVSSKLYKTCETCVSACQGIDPRKPPMG